MGSQRQTTAVARRSSAVWGNDDQFVYLERSKRRKKFEFLTVSLPDFAAAQGFHGVTVKSHALTDVRSEYAAFRHDVEPRGGLVLSYNCHLTDTDASPRLLTI